MNYSFELYFVSYDFIVFARGKKLQFTAAFAYNIYSYFDVSCDAVSGFQECRGSFPVVKCTYCRSEFQQTRSESCAKSFINRSC